MWRRFRSDPVQRLRERLDSFGTTMEPRWVLDHEALMEARPLYDLLDGVSRRGASEREAEALFLLACLHWYRYQCLPAGSDGPDLIQAVGLTELLLSLAPERVPPSLLAMLRAHVSAGPGRDVGSGASARAILVPAPESGRRVPVPRTRQVLGPPAARAAVRRPPVFASRPRAPLPRPSWALRCSARRSC
ncbi:hypothetical protein [Verrucosispora sioxanthis]|uniref:hypothetical protein n=1 Tax=Verrucosispora sioxanthis TaxID=2499994 RepID=UPI001C10F88B|nr:hypothetical protein [Verrucosispora sioxanthis]